MENTFLLLTSLGFLGIFIFQFDFHFTLFGQKFRVHNEKREPMDLVFAIGFFLAWTVTKYPHLFVQ